MDVNLLDVVYLRGDFGISFDGVTDEVTFVAQNVEAGLEVGDFAAGIENGTLGLFIDGDGDLVVEASGSLFVDFPVDIGLSADIVRLRINQTGEVYTGEDLSVADIGYTFGTIEAATDLIEVAVENAQLNIADFVTVEGNLAIRSQTATVDTVDETDIEVELLTIGAGSVNAFAGYKANTDDEIGLRLTDVNVALALMDEVSGTRSWTSLQATVGGAAFVGVDDPHTLEVTDFALEVNRAASDDSVIDFSGDNSLLVSTGVTTSMTLDMDGADGELIQAVGSVSFGLFGFATLTGNFAIVSRSETVTLYGEKKLTLTSSRWEQAMVTSSSDSMVSVSKPLG